MQGSVPEVLKWWSTGEWFTSITLRAKRIESIKWNKSKSWISITSCNRGGELPQEIEPPLVCKHLRWTWWEATVFTKLIIIPSTEEWVQVLWPLSIHILNVNLVNIDSKKCILTHQCPCRLPSTSTLPTPPSSLEDSAAWLHSTTMETLPITAIQFIGNLLKCAVPAIFTRDLPAIVPSILLWEAILQSTTLRWVQAADTGTLQTILLLRWTKIETTSKANNTAPSPMNNDLDNKQNYHIYYWLLILKEILNKK